MARRTTIQASAGLSDANAKASIRNMDLSDNQRMMLIDDELRRILTSKTTDELQGGMIRPIIDYPYDKDGFTVLNTIINADVRLVQMAWDYYKDNASEPTVEKFVHKLWEILGTSEQYRRVVTLHLN